MKIKDYKSDNGTKTQPCDLTNRYLFHEESGGTLTDFLMQFDFDSREEIAAAIRHFMRTIVLDPYMRTKDLAESNPAAAIVYSRYKKIVTDAAKLEKMPTSLSGELWHGGYSRMRLAQRTAQMFKIEKSQAVFDAACERIKAIYNLTQTDIEKLHFFVEQVKAGEQFPNSLRRMLYIWGTEKMTGKTTSATMLVSLLNGDWCENNIARYSTTLSNEMQIKSFAVPKIAECNVCLMDECFYNDMGKTYADFKRFLTSSNGRARLPFGQEFEWEGQPNYIATSNDSLQKFIKDWGDRRYLSIEFKSKPTEQLDFESIKQLWADFIRNSKRTKEWAAWAAELAPESNEVGERTMAADEFELELRKIEMLDRIIDIKINGKQVAANPDNHTSLKKFVDWFSMDIGHAEAHKRKGEIERAVINVYGERYSSTGYWLTSELQKKANELKDAILYANDDNTTLVTYSNNDDDLPF